MRLRLKTYNVFSSTLKYPKMQMKVTVFATYFVNVFKSLIFHLSTYERLHVSTNFESIRFHPRFQAFLHMK